MNKEFCFEKEGGRLLRISETTDRTCIAVQITAGGTGAIKLDYEDWRHLCDLRYELTVKKPKDTETEPKEPPAPPDPTL